MSYPESSTNFSNYIYHNHIFIKHQSEHRLEGTLNLCRFLCSLIVYKLPAAFQIQPSQLRPAVARRHRKGEEWDLHKQSCAEIVEKALCYHQNSRAASVFSFSLRRTTNFSLKGQIAVALLYWTCDSTVFVFLSVLISLLSLFASFTCILTAFRGLAI